ncbi:MAG: DinB family protein [Gemmatimonadales bacterium]
MSERSRLVDELDRVFRGDPWYGPSVRDVLQDVTAREARVRPLPAAHSIWELVLHMTGWKAEVRSRLGGAAAGTPPQGDWPAVPDRDDQWTDALATLAATHEDLLDAIRSASDATLEGPVRDERNPALGTGLTQWQTLRGILQHDVYHLGQISLLKRAVRG